MIILLDSYSVGSKQCPKVFDGTLSGLRPSCAAGCAADGRHRAVDAAESGRDASGWAVVTFARVARQLTTSSRTAGLPVTRRSPVQAPFPAARLDPSHIPFCPCEIHIRRDTITHKLGPVGEAVSFVCTCLSFESR